MSNYYKLFRKSWRRFYIAHREVLDFLGDFLAVLSIFVFVYFMYIVLWIFEIGC